MTGALAAWPRPMTTRATIKKVRGEPGPWSTQRNSLKHRGAGRGMGVSCGDTPVAERRERMWNRLPPPAAPLGMAQAQGSAFPPPAQEKAPGSMPSPEGHSPRPYLLPSLTLLHPPTAVPEEDGMAGPSAHSIQKPRPGRPPLKGAPGDTGKVHGRGTPWHPAPSAIATNAPATFPQGKSGLPTPPSRWLLWRRDAPPGQSTAAPPVKTEGCSPHPFPR